MTLKQYQIAKLVIVIILAIIFSQALIYKNYLIPLGAVIILSLILFFMRSKVKEVINDERDWQTAGKAAGYAIQIYSWFAVIVMLILYSQHDLNPSYLPIAATLAYSTCFLMFLYALIYRYYNKLCYLDKKVIYIAIIILIMVLMAVFGLRLFSGEDDWICQNGQWFKHGNPDFPAPTVECK